MKQGDRYAMLTAVELVRVDTNCRFTTTMENNRNRRSTRFWCVGELRLSQGAWESMLGMRQGTISGWKYQHGERYVEQRLMAAVSRSRTQEATT